MRALLLALVVLLVAQPASAHDFSPGVLALSETSPGVFDVRWTEPVDSGNEAAAVRPVFPAQCRSEANLLDCRPGGLHGELRIEGMNAPRMQVIVVVRRVDSSTEEALLSAKAAHMELRRRPASAALAWLRTGTEHILLGFDHLAFLFGLMLVVASRRTLIATITAFTLAHSVTLGLATLGWLRLPSVAVEATIAASVVLVAREALHDGPTLTRRAPWAVALLFGLVHGLGFASALGALGLPERGLGFKLLWFNLGVELGQLAVVVLVLAGAELARRVLRETGSVRRLAAYAIGALGAFWLIERSVALALG